jgi:hypothetical protein
MNSQNIDPNQKDDIKDASEVSNLKKPEHSGLDDWNERLDENLEPEKGGDEEADDNARDFSNENGSGDQSDEG